VENELRQKYELFQKEAKIHANKAAALERRDLSKQLQQGLHLIKSLVCVVSVGKLSDQEFEQGIGRLGVDVKSYIMDSKFVKDLLDWKHVIWFAPSPKIENSIIWPGGFPTPPSLACRLIGGFVAGVEWLDTCLSCGFIVQPVLRLTRAVEVPRQIFVHKSIPEHLMCVIDNVLIEAGKHTAGSMHWVRKTKRKELPKPRFQSPACFGGTFSWFDGLFDLGCAS
jgi:hypothetical protein